MTDRMKKTSLRSAEFIASAAAIAAGTVAYGEVIRYENPAGPGQYDWRPVSDDAAISLDVTLPADAQISDASGPAVFVQGMVCEECSCYIETIDLCSSQVSSQGSMLAQPGDFIGVYIASGIAPGELIGTDRDELFLPSTFGSAVVFAGCGGGYCSWAGGTEFSSLPQYMGVRFTLKDGVHYRMDRRRTPRGDGS